MFTVPEFLGRRGNRFSLADGENDVNNVEETQESVEIVLKEVERLDAIVQRTRDGGAEIVKYLKTGSAYYAPSAAAAEMVEAILKDKKKILPCAAYLEGEYGLQGLFVGVPCKLGTRGIEQIIEIKLTPQEKAALEKSAGAVKELVSVIGV